MHDIKKFILVNKIKILLLLIITFETIIIIRLILIGSINLNLVKVDYNWLGFWGSFLGGIFGGLATLIGVRYTISKMDEERKDKEKERDQ